MHGLRMGRLAESGMVKFWETAQGGELGNKRRVMPRSSQNSVSDLMNRGDW